MRLSVKKAASKKTKKTDVDDRAAVDAFLARIAAGPRAALQELRRQIRAAAPDAVEGISYGAPAFRQAGPLVSYNAATNHCALYVMDGGLLEELGDEVKPWARGKGTLHFNADDPLPPTLVAKIVALRIAKNERRARR